MRKLIYVLFFLPLVIHAQIKNVTVETYYVSDDSDATDSTGGQGLEPGSKTYRVFIELPVGYKLKKIYGDAAHPVKISSTSNFYNNADRPSANFGYLINKSWFATNPLLALDSWLTLGRATKSFSGVLKADDTDGTIVGGTNNNGGSAGVQGGLLTNNDTSAGIPLTVADGMMNDATVLGQWIDNGFKDAGGNDTTVFGAWKIGSSFVSYNSSLQQSSGIKGIGSVNNVLVAQLTTKGNISFELNVEVVDSAGNSIFYVAKGQDRDTLSPSGTIVKERYSRFLKYPPECGCRDPRYLEYDKSYACDEPSQCITPVIFGCMDPMACNYNPKVNFSVPSLCCYPGYCNDRDLEVVCPSVTTNNGLKIYPNPADNHIRLQSLKLESEHGTVNIFNFRGEKIFTREMYVIANEIDEDINLSGLNPGIYFLQFVTEDRIYDSKILIKN